MTTDSVSAVGPASGPTGSRPGRRRLPPRPDQRRSWLPRRSELWGSWPTAEVPERLGVALEAMTVAGLVCAWLVAQILLFGNLSQMRAQATLYGQFRTELAQATAPTGGIIRPGRPVSLVTIPAIGLQQVVVEGTSSGQLLKAPGHLRNSVLPGQAGTSVVYGRARSYGGPFSGLVKLSVGQTITTVTAQGKATYRVDGIRRPGQASPQPLAAGAGRLTLVTAQGNGPLGALTPNRVVYVDATLTSKAFTPPSGMLNAVTPSELPMARDTSVMPALALSLGFLAVVVAGAVFARQKFGALLVWVIAAPVVIALTWESADLAMYLLPNLL